MDEDTALFYDLFHADVPVTRIKHNRFRQDLCYSVPKEATLIYNANEHYADRNFELEKEATRELRRNITAKLDHSVSEHPRILLTNRRDTRRIENFEEVVAEFSNVFGANRTTVYDDKGSTLEKTVEIFNDHDIFVHFHGAAGANAIFMPPLSLVIEVTTFINYESSKQWRSNAKVARVADGITWMVCSP